MMKVAELRSNRAVLVSFFTAMTKGLDQNNYREGKIYLGAHNFRGFNLETADFISRGSWQRVW